MRFDLHFGPSFVRRPPADGHAISQLEGQLGFSLPSSYRCFLLETNGGEGPVGDAGWISLAGVEEVPNYRVQSGMADLVPSFVPIGSDGAGEAFGFLPVDGEFWFGFMPFIGASLGDFVPIGRDFWRSIFEI